MTRFATIRSASNAVLVGMLQLAVAAASAGAGYPQVGGTGALEFDGVDDYVTLGNPSSLRLSGDLSLCAWMKLGAGTSGRYMGIAGKVNANRQGFALARHSNNGLLFLVGCVNGTALCGSPYTTTDSEWHHVAGVIRGGAIHLYVDGALVCNSPSSPPHVVADSGQYAYVGKLYSDSDGWFFKGLIDEVCFYARGLSTSEIQAALSMRPSTADSSLVGHWSFDEAGGQVVSDRSTRHNDGYLGRTTGADSSDPGRVSAGGTPAPGCQSQWTYTLTFDNETGGVLRMQNRIDPRDGHTVPAKAIFAFNDGLCRAGEDADLYKYVGVTISFDYLFRSEGGALRVWASTHVDDGFANSVTPPSSGSAGSSTSTNWARHSAIIGLPYDVATQPAIEVTLELRGPANTLVLIDNLSVMIELGMLTKMKLVHWIPPVQCSSLCGDITGDDHYVGQEDYLAGAYHCGSAASLDNRCVDGVFTKDGYVSVEDVESIAWAGAGLNICPAGLQSMSEMSLPAAAIVSNAHAASLNSPLLIAGKAYSCNPYTATHSFWSDRVFGFDLSSNPTADLYRRTEDRLNTRLVRDNLGRLHQLHVKEGLVRLSDGQVILNRCALQFGANFVDVGWIAAYESPPIQDAAFDASGYLYVVPVSVTPWNGDPDYRAAARIDVTKNPPQVMQLYKSPEPFAKGVYEIEIDHNQNVYVLDKRNWSNSILLRYNRYSGALTGQPNMWSVPSDVRATALHVSRKDGRIYIANSRGDASSLIVLNPTNFAKIREVQIRGLHYISDIAEYATASSSGTIWAAGYALPESLPTGDMANKACLRYPPLFKPVLVQIPSWSSGPIEAEPLYDYGEEGTEYLSLPLSIVCTGDDY